MNVPYASNEARQRLAEAISQHSASSAIPLPISIWVAMSCLQKAIRRGRQDIALRAAATLLDVAPERLWRRCAGILFEDIGVADFPTISLAMAGLTGKRFRKSVGGDWAVASVVVTAMCRAPKCRAADDLLMTAEMHPWHEGARSSFAALPTLNLLGLATGASSLPERAIAAWYAAGTHWRTTRHLLPRRGEPQLLFDHLKDEGYPPAVIDLVREGFRKGAGILAPFVAMLAPLLCTPTTTEDDQFPPEAMIGEVPGWALDIYSREGRTSLEAFLNGASAAATWVRGHIRPTQRMRFLGAMLFRVEGGLVKQRLRWSVGDELRKTMDVECHGPQCHDAAEVLALMGSDIALLNRIRTRCFCGAK